MTMLLRGATTVEFALLLAAMVIGCAAGFRALGHGTARAVDEGSRALLGERSVRLTDAERGAIVRAPFPPGEGK